MSRSCRDRSSVHQSKECFAPRKSRSALYRQKPRGWHGAGGDRARGDAVDAVLVHRCREGLQGGVDVPADWGGQANTACRERTFLD